MGLDLTVAFDQYSGNGSQWWFPRNKLEFHRSRELFDLINGFPQTPVPDSLEINWYNDEGIEVIKTDPYGDPLTFVEAKYFREIAPDDESDLNNSILRFLQSLDPKTPILLYWH